MSPIKHFFSNLPIIVAVLEVPIWVSLQERSCCSAIRSAVESASASELRTCSSRGSPQPVAKWMLSLDFSFQLGTPLMSSLCSGIPHGVDHNLFRYVYGLNPCAILLSHSLFLTKCDSPVSLFHSQFCLSVCFSGGTFDTTLMAPGKWEGQVPF